MCGKSWRKRLRVQARLEAAFPQKNRSGTPPPHRRKSWARCDRVSTPAIQNRDCWGPRSCYLSMDGERCGDPSKAAEQIPRKARDDSGSRIASHESKHKILRPKDGPLGTSSRVRWLNSKRKQMHRSFDSHSVASLPRASLRMTMPRSIARVHSSTPTT